VRDLFIYAVRDEKGVARYVGKTKDPFKRFDEHYRNESIGFSVCVMEILERAENGKQASAAERKWIAHYGRDRLINKHVGGGGVHYVGARVRKQTSETMKAIWSDPSEKARRAEKMKKVYSSEAVRQRVRAAVNEALKDPAKRARIVAGFKVVANSPEIIARRAATLRRTLARKRALAGKQKENA
jgi:predicted GIY-YIG superfamily endonuclease